LEKKAVEESEAKVTKLDNKLVKLRTKQSDLLQNKRNEIELIKTFNEEKKTRAAKICELENDANT